MLQEVICVLLLSAVVFGRQVPGSGWDNDNLHPVRKPGPSGYRDYINNPGSGEIPDWHQLGQKSIQDAVQRARRMIQLDHKARNVIFFMGDGLGLPTVTAARVYRAQARNITGDDAVLSWEKFPYTAFSKTYATDLLTPDSANTATAMMCGEKCGETIICANQHVRQGNCSTLEGNHLKSVVHHAIDRDMWTGVVSTARITHASPSVNYAHSAHRDWESDTDLPPDASQCADIARQLIDVDTNHNIRVILGGGRYNFKPQGTADPEYPDDPDSNGNRLDHRDLTQEWLELQMERGMTSSEVAYVQNLEEFNDVDADRIQYLMGLFEPGHMQYEVDRTDEPSLSEMVEKSIQILSRSAQGYFLFVESGRIDTAHHANNAFRALNETVALSDAVQKAVDMTSEDDTLIILTSDHSHVFSVAGYPARNADIFGWDTDWNIWGQDGDDGVPYTTLQYSNGPGYYVHRTEDGTLDKQIPRKNMTGEPVDDPDFIQDAGIPVGSETHAGEDVPIYARGPMAHLLHGTQEQNYIAHVIKYALCIGENTDLCDNPPPALDQCVSQATQVLAVTPVLLIGWIAAYLM